jgi:hypothetical protein
VKADVGEVLRHVKEVAEDPRRVEFGRVTQDPPAASALSALSIEARSLQRSGADLVHQ